MQQFELKAEPRLDVGKGASRRLRQTGKLPGIVYGTKKDATPISLVQNELLQQLQHEAFFSHILTINLDGNSEKVVLKDLQRHPSRPMILHADFQRIDENEKLTMRVPIHFINAAKCAGVKTGGGVVSHIMTEIEVLCLPKDLPEYIEIDLEPLELNQSVHLGELRMPEGVENYTLMHGGSAAQPVVTVHIPRVIEEEEVAAEPEAEEAGAAVPAEEAGAEKAEEEPKD